MKTNRLIRKSSVLFMALAVFAMIFTGCKKDSSSSSSSGGGDTPTPTPPTGNYGTIVVGDQTYSIHLGVYTVSYDESIATNVVGIALTDGTAQTANSYVLAIPFYEDIPTGTFSYYFGEEPHQGQCGGVFVKGGSSTDMLVCMSGTATITKVGEKYKIVSQGQATPDTQRGISFSVDFEGPLTFEEE